MLYEVKYVRQIQGEPARRWFLDDDFDLLVWQNGSRVVGFQLCYADNAAPQKVLKWTLNDGLHYFSVDSGETVPAHYKGTPMLIPSPPEMHLSKVAQRFLHASAQIPSGIKQSVYQQLQTTRSEAVVC